MLRLGADGKASRVDWWNVLQARTSAETKQKLSVAPHPRFDLVALTQLKFCDFGHLGEKKKKHFNLVEF